MEQAEIESLSLLELYDQATLMYNNLEEGNIDREDYDQYVDDTTNCLKHAIYLIRENGLFADNEVLDDIPTSSLKYISLYFYYSNILTRPSTPDPKIRYSLVQQQIGTLNHFIEFCVEKQIADPVDVEIYNREEHELTAEQKRSEKIERYKREKDLQKKMQSIMQEKMKSGLDETEEQNEEFERKITLLIIRSQVTKSLDTLMGAESEKEMLSGIVKMLEEHGEIPKPKSPEPRERRPDIHIKSDRHIKQEVAAKAFLPGWNLPTMTIEEAADIDLHEALEREARQNEAQKQKKLVKEFGDSSDDSEEVYKKREWDAWADDHPVGEGNTGTKGYHY
eukprot:TRINITY_DN12137_c0_g1_i1.p1 TRINITY_DN12137_c0_g1~~TRINITY_DN12137_c0_g1_i1.p1  ORF type:complete len:348 (-),score=100.11 TRINITY_DN12137_c0_g1_i1:90-1097(-)